MKKLRVSKTEAQQILIELRLIRNAINKGNVTLDEVLRVMVEQVERDERDDDELL